VPPIGEATFGVCDRISFGLRITALSVDDAVITISFSSDFDDY